MLTNEGAGGEDVMVVISVSFLRRGTFTSGSVGLLDCALRLLAAPASSSKISSSDGEGPDDKSSCRDGRPGDEGRDMDTTAWKSILRLTGSGVMR